MLGSCVVGNLWLEDWDCDRRRPHCALPGLQLVFVDVVADVAVVGAPSVFLRQVCADLAAGVVAVVFDELLEEIVGVEFVFDSSFVSLLSLVFS